MRRTRGLVLRREALSELTSRDLSDVAGGTVERTLVPCYSDQCTGAPSYGQPTNCFTLPVNQCLTTP